VEFHRAGDEMMVILNEITRQTLNFPENSNMTQATDGLTVGNQPRGN
jgi:hypothetical protein